MCIVYSFRRDQYILLVGYVYVKDSRNVRVVLVEDRGGIDFRIG